MHLTENPWMCGCGGNRAISEEVIDKGSRGLAGYMTECDKCGKIAYLSASFLESYYKIRY